MNHAEEIAQLLEKTYPHAKTELVHANGYQLAVAVALSAQTTDKLVNQVTPALFAKYPNWEALAQAKVEEVAQLIRKVNFYSGKAARLVAAGKFVVENYGGKLPDLMERLVKIPGIARKSANVILNEVFNKAEGIVVDTHVSRVSARLGLTVNTDPKKIELDLMNQLPHHYWRNFSTAMVLHGRYVCTARRPLCFKCVLREVCPFLPKTLG